MSALAIILTAAMVAPGDGSEKVSGERVVQKLDLSGRWSGTVHINCKGCEGVIEGVEFNLKGLGVIDEGAGRMRFKRQGVTYHGIYEQCADRLEICFSLDTQSCPDRFQAGEGQCLIVLRRVKSSK